MCGIAGFNWQDDVLGRRMAELIRHRGPDACGFYSKGERLSLVHTRLSIIDLHERSNQPLHYEHCGRKYVLVFNGEIYNYRELRLELELLGCRFQTQADSEVILAAYAAWGRKSVGRFNGMWAFAIFDEHENALFLSRDRFGKKPLYYYNTNGRFIFASEIKAILGCPQVSRVADSEMVSDLLNFELAGHTDGTFFRDVKQLPAGTNGVLDLATGHLHLERYYTFPRSMNSASPSDIHQALRAAVTRRLVSDVPISLSLSGGVDSSAVAAMIAEDHDNRMIAFTTVSRDSQGDETANVLKLLEMYPQFELIKVPLDMENIQGDLQRIIFHMDEPITLDSPFVRWKIAEAIHHEGFKVSITGEGADELLGGYAVSSHVFLADLWRRRKLPRLALELACASLQPDWRRIGSQFVLRFAGSREQRTRDFFVHGARQFGCRTAPTGSGADLRTHDETLKEQLYSQVTRFFLPFLLACNDKMYMAHAVETRAPFLDVEMAELLLGIATERLIVRGMRKYPLRQAMRGLVPRSVLFDRRKIGFASSLRTRLSLPAAKQWVRSLFTDARTASFIDPQAFLAAYEAVPPKTEVEGFVLRALTLELWMRQFDVTAA